MKAVRLRDLPAALARSEAAFTFQPLMIVELWAAGPDALPCFGRYAPVVCTFDDSLALVLGHGAQKRDEASSWRLLTTVIAILAVAWIIAFVGFWIWAALT